MGWYEDYLAVVQKKYEEAQAELQLAIDEQAAAAEDALNSMNQSNETDEILATTDSYSVDSLFGKLQKRGINPLRPEILAIIEFLPLAINDSESTTEYTNLNFGTDAIVTNATRAAKFCEMQRILKETNYNSIVSLVEKESGMTISLIKRIINYYIYVLNMIGQSSSSSSNFSKIFTSTNITLDIAASNLIINDIADNFIYDSNAADELFGNYRNQNIKSNEPVQWMSTENISISNKLNFINAQESVTFWEFIKTNSNNKRIIVLARCALMQAVITGIIKRKYTIS